MRKAGILAGWILTVILLGVSAQADSWSINYQAFLTDSDGAPVDSVVTVQFSAYNTDLGGAPLWTDTQAVEAEQGLITTSLGNPANPFPTDLFDSSVFIGITINGEVMQPRRQLVSSAFTFRAANSDLLSGLPASSYDQSADVQNLQDQVTSQETRLTAVETSPSDITAVVAGTGLSGGAQSGSATLSLATGGVTAANMSFNAVSGGAIQAGAVNSIKIENGSVAAVDLAANSVDSSKIADNSITSSDIVDGTIGPNDINAQASFTVGALTVGDDSTINGDLSLAGTLTVSEQLVVQSNANVGGSAAIGGNLSAQADIEAGSDLTVAKNVVIGEDVNIGGDTTFFGSVGIAYIQRQVNMESTGSAYLCDDGQTVCKIFSATAQCPNGYLAVGGGVSMTNSNRAKILDSHPGDNASTSWKCSTQDSLGAPVDDFCFANCLRITGL